jgi:AmiR/NasT family two-component response regulator
MQGPAPPPADNQKPEPVTDALPGLVGKRIVVIEDDGITQWQLRKSLAREGLIIVGAATNGQEGTAIVLRERPDLVLMDIGLPVRNGLDAAEHILAVFPVCIVVVTAFADAEHRERARQLGVAGYVVKPIDVKTLLPRLVAAYRSFHERGVGRETGQAGPE